MVRHVLLAGTMFIPLRSAALALGLLACAACSSPSEDGAAQGSAVNQTQSVAACANVWTPAGPERKAILNGVHGHFDPRVKQSNEYVVSSFLTDGNKAFVQGEIVGLAATPGGKRAEIDWSRSDYARDVAEGLFDGGRFEALMEKTGDTWSVVKYGEGSEAIASSVGSTDVWWQDLAKEANVSPSLFPIPQAVCTPAVGTQDRRAITDAVQKYFAASFAGQSTEYDVPWVRTDGVYAFMRGEVKGNIDWTKTAFAEYIKEGLFDGAHVEALVKRTGSGWRVVEYTVDGDKRTAAGIGSTDVWWDGLWDQAAEPGTIPRSLFPGGDGE